MERITSIFKALSDNNRLRIFTALLDNDELCACQLTELINVTSATASRHMGVLISSGLVESRKDGRWVYYKINKNNSENNPLIKWIEKQLIDSAKKDSDAKKISKILSLDPEELCRNQRGEKCCPKS